MRVVKGLARPADAYQFLKETEDQLAGLVLQTGPVTVQRADELNRIPGRCYVPTIWGAAVLEYGDWFVVYDIGVVSAFNDAQFRLLFEFDDNDLMVCERVYYDQATITRQLKGLADADD